MADKHFRRCVSDQMMHAIRSIIYAYGPDAAIPFRMSLFFWSLFDVFRQTEQSDNFSSFNCGSKRKLA